MRVTLQRRVLQRRQRRALARQFALQLQHRQVAGQCDLEDLLDLLRGPAQTLGDQERGDRGVHRALHTVGDVGVVFLAQHLEDGQIGVALDQHQHRVGGVFQRGLEAVVRRVLQRLSDARQALAPQAGQLGRLGMAHALGLALQLFQIDHRAAYQQRLHLIAAFDDVAAGQQQRQVSIAHVERQGLSDLDALPDGGEFGGVHVVLRWSARTAGLPERLAAVFGRLTTNLTCGPSWAWNPANAS
jgi:hypothetical protein